MSDQRVKRIIRPIRGPSVIIQFTGLNPNNPKILFSSPPLVPKIPCFHIIDVPTTGAMQGIKIRTLKRVLRDLRGIDEIRLAKLKDRSIFKDTATRLKRTVLIKALKNSGSENILI